jgi:hypothetical protein
MSQDQNYQWRAKFVGRGRCDGVYGNLMFVDSVSEPTTREHVEMFVAADTVQFRVLPPDTYDGKDLFLARPPAWRIKTTAPNLAGTVASLPTVVPDSVAKAMADRAKIKAAPAPAPAPAPVTTETLGYLPESAPPVSQVSVQAPPPASAPPLAPRVTETLPGPAPVLSAPPVPATHETKPRFTRRDRHRA